MSQTVSTAGLFRAYLRADVRTHGEPTHTGTPVTCVWCDAETEHTLSTAIADLDALPLTTDSVPMIP